MRSCHFVVDESMTKLYDHIEFDETFRNRYGTMPFSYSNFESISLPSYRVNVKETKKCWKYWKLMCSRAFQVLILHPKTEVKSFQWPTLYVEKNLNSCHDSIRIIRLCVYLYSNFSVFDVFDTILVREAVASEINWFYAACLFKR